MKAVAVTPGETRSARLMEVAPPEPSDKEVLVKVLRVGQCGTDTEIAEGLMGVAPPGEFDLILGHEVLGRIAAVGSSVRGFQPGDYVVATVRRPGDCPNCRSGESDMCLDGRYSERGITARHGFLCEYFAESPDFLVQIPPALEAVGVLLEPLSVCEKAISQAFAIQSRMQWRPHNALVLGAGGVGLLATMVLRNMGLDVYNYAQNPEDSPSAEIIRQMGGAYFQAGAHSLESLSRQVGPPDLIFEAAGYSPLAFDAMGRLARNGVMCLIGVTPGDRRLEIPVDHLHMSLMMGNRLVFGSVNSNRTHFEMGVRDMSAFEARWPGLMRRLITRRLPIEQFAEGLHRRPTDIKVVVEVA